MNKPNNEMQAFLLSIAPFSFWYGLSRNPIGWKLILNIVLSYIAFFLIFALCFEISSSTYITFIKKDDSKFLKVIKISVILLAYFLIVFGIRELIK